MGQSVFVRKKGGQDAQEWVNELRQEWDRDESQ